MTHKIAPKIFVIIFLAAATAACRKGGKKWQGSIETIDGVVVVSNPIESVYHDSVISLEEEGVIQDDTDENGLIFSMLASIDVDGEGKIYVADQQEGRIHVFDSSGSRLFSFGKRGQGPGEMAFPFSISITPRNEILVNDWILRRVSFFTSEGEFIRQTPSASLLFLRTKSDTKGNLFGSYMIPGKNPQFKLEKFSSKLEPLATIDAVSMPPMPEMSIFIPHFFWKLIDENQIFWGNIAEYEFSISDSEGNVIKKIRKEYAPVKTTNRIQENWQEEFNWDYIPPFANAQIDAPDFYPPFHSFGVDDFGRLIVRTFEKDKESEVLYDIFDDEGRYMAKVALGIPPLEPRRYVWKNGRLYTIETDKDGFQVIKIYRAIWNRI